MEAKSYVDAFNLDSLDASWVRRFRCQAVDRSQVCSNSGLMSPSLVYFIRAFTTKGSMNATVGPEKWPLAAWEELVLVQQLQEVALEVSSTQR